MIGLMVLGFYLVFWLLCWLFSWAIFNKESIKSRLFRVVLFLGMSLTPYWIYLFQYTHFADKCNSLTYSSPNEKIARPSSILIYQGINPNVNYKEDGESKVLRKFESASFDFIVAPSYTRWENIRWDEVKGSEDINVYPRIFGDEVNNNEVIQSTKYGMLTEKQQKYGIWHQKISVVNLFDGEEQSWYEEVWQVRNANSFSNFLLPYNLGKCISREVEDERLLPQEVLLLNTFYFS